ncbi:hypothetical protein [Pseudomonas juntendi]|uniref:Uncharacterized protein n=1 Tax=Pseudomonas juntendi TaxID=2666183 RepID=A0A7W2KFI8_9PSED|nr:hypothetical protein [Pseudomonas juntendi]MBA6097462.1 hypothetical protein [Pseudomonas juntendi]MBA6130817.1 hypothetical protein [Pseudomonas juntendi]
MARPAHLRLTGGKEPRQLIWEAIRESRDDFSAKSIAKKSGETAANVLLYVKCMAKANVVELIDATGKQPDQRWRLLQDEGAEHPRLNRNGERTQQGRALENIWRTLKIAGEVTAAEVAELSSADGVKVTQAYASNYLSILAQAGYVDAIDRDLRRAVSYRLKPNGYSGPRYPVVQREEYVRVFDQNQDAVVFTKRRIDGVPLASEPANEVQQENIRMRGLLEELLKAGRDGVSESLMQRVLLELA